VPEPSAFEFEMVIEKLNRHKSPSIVQMPAEFITEGGRRIGSHPLIILFEIRRICQRIGRSQSLYISIRRVVNRS
jgi:hypothetical protein